MWSGDLRWVFLILVNWWLRPEFALFFDNHTADSSILIKVIIYLILFIVLALKTSPTLDNNFDLVNHRLLIDHRHAFSPYSIVAFVFYLLVPPSVLVYISYPILVYLSFTPLIHYLLWSFLRHFGYSPNPSWLTTPPNLIRPELRYYDARYILLSFINWFLRPCLGILLFHFVNTSPLVLLIVFFFIVIISLIFLKYRVSICFTTNEDGLFLILVKFDREEPSFVVIYGFFAYLIIPVYNFNYKCISLIIQLIYTLWPSFFNNFFHRQALRLQAAFDAFLAFNPAIINIIPEQPANEGRLTISDETMEMELFLLLCIIVDFFICYAVLFRRLEAKETGYQFLQRSTPIEIGK